jgi:hypothetical protein
VGSAEGDRVGARALLTVADTGVYGGDAVHRAAVEQCLRRLSFSSHLAVAEWVITVMVAELTMKTDNRSALHTLIRTPTDAERPDLLVMVQTACLNRLTQ